MTATMARVRVPRLSALLDYFIPKDIQVNAESHRRARMFMLSHVFGPILGGSIPIYLMLMGTSRDIYAWVFLYSILLFWLYPIALRLTGAYQVLCFLSVQNLIFCALWACYSYGGASSPFLPWILIFPLLAFLYLPPIGWVRNLLLVQIFGSVAVFITHIFLGGPLPAVNLQHFQIIGMISMASVAIYFGMMSLYFAKMFNEQRDFTREINSMISTSDNLRNLTDAANQARTAKADFLASMSHELRTPLNAIIGYSQILLEDARDEGDEDTVTDIGHVNKAGSDLLRLIDDILAYSRVEAGKMPVNPSRDRVRTRFDDWLDKPMVAEITGTYPVSLVGVDRVGRAVTTDWHIICSVFYHTLAGLFRQHGSGRLDIHCDTDGQAGLILTLVDHDEAGAVRPISISAEMFENARDSSASKYGNTGIEFALAGKLAQLIEGELAEAVNADGTPCARLVIPDLDAPARLAA